MSRIRSGVLVTFLAFAMIVPAEGAPGPGVRGVVLVATNLRYQGISARGTGVVLTGRGEVLTNNHVIRGATEIRVIDPDNGRSYPATIAGYDVSADIAVLSLRGASGLPTIRFGRSAAVRRGDAVTGYGNAGGLGKLRSAAGAILELGKTATVVFDDGGTQKLTGLIETNAGLQPGDSGGPLLDAAGRAIGIGTAASVGLVFSRAPAGRGYAIPIDQARSIAAQIIAGRPSASVHVGPTAFIGVDFQPGGQYTGLTPGVTVVKVVAGSPAAKAGLRAGDVVTGVDGVPITTTSHVEASMLKLKPGSRLTLAWTGLTGVARTATLTVASGPAQ